MIIMASTALRNDYSAISELVKKMKEPIYITKNGEGNRGVFDSLCPDKKQGLYRNYRWSWICMERLNAC